MKRSAIFFLGLLGMASAEASVTYGNDVIERSRPGQGQGWGNYLVLETSTLAAGDGIANQWEVWGKQAGTVASVILTPGPPPSGVTLPGGSTFNPTAFQTQYYEVTGVSQHDIAEGYNKFGWTPTSGTAEVKTGSVFGLWIGTGRVALNLGSEIIPTPVTTPVIGYFDTYGGALTTWAASPSCTSAPNDASSCASLNAYLTANPSVNGNNQFPSAPMQGTQFLVTYEDPRLYSSKVTVVPIPAAIWLFGSAMAGVFGFGRITRKACA
jgi:hypothetical protein